MLLIVTFPPKAATTAQSPVATPPKTTAAATNKSAATSAKKTAAGQTTAGNKRRADDSIESVAKKGKIEAKKLADLKKMENDLVPVIAKAAEYCRGETMPSNDAELGMQCALAGALKEMKKKGYRIFREPATKQLGIDNEVIENWIRPDFVLMTNQHSCYLVIEIKVKPKAYVSDKDEKQLKGYIASIGAAGFWETDMKTSKKWLPRQPFDDHHYETQADGKRPIWGRLICFGQDGSLMQKVYELDPATGKVIDRK